MGRRLRVSLRVVLFDTCGAKSEGGWWGRERPDSKVVRSNPKVGCIL